MALRATGDDRGDAPGDTVGAESLSDKKLIQVGGSKILLVEDEPSLLTAVSKILRKKGFSILEARDGETAIRLLRQHMEIGLVLLDVSLPDVSSRQVVMEARRIQAAMPIILTSAFGQDQVTEMFAGLQIDHFVRKPYRVAELAGLLQRTIRLN